MKKKILCFFTSLVIFMSTVTINSKAEAKTMRLHIIVSETYLYKNGLSNGVGSHLTYNFYIASSVYNYAVGIHLVKDPFVYSSSTIINTNAGNCPNITGPSTYDNECNCTTNTACNKYSGLHHTNIHYIVDHSLPVSLPSEKINVLLVGNTLCRKSSTGTHVILYGMCEPSYKSLIVQDAVLTDSHGDDFSIFALTLIHEIGHLYDVVDHYNNPYNNPNCIWGAYYNTPYVASHLPICSNCLSTLKANKNRYNHIQ